jgi:hypothetical protein
MSGPLYTVKLWRMGASIVLSIQKGVREKLHWDIDQLLICRIHGPFLIIRAADPPVDFPLDQIPANAYPPAWPGKHTLKPLRDEGEEK